MTRLELAVAAVLSGELLIAAAAKKYTVKKHILRSALFARERPAEVAETAQPPTKHWCDGCQTYYTAEFCVRCAAIRNMSQEAAGRYHADRAIKDVISEDLGKYKHGIKITKLG